MSGIPYHAWMIDVLFITFPTTRLCRYYGWVLTGVDCCELTATLWLFKDDDTRPVEIYYSDVGRLIKAAGGEPVC